MGTVRSSGAKKALIFIDGASRGNPGPAAVGVVIQNGKGEVLKALSSRIGTATNNTAEYLALVVALQQALMMGLREIEIRSDSELLVKQYLGEYKVKEDSLKQFFLLVMHLRRGFDKLIVKHIPREENKLADREANRALDQELFL